MDKAARLRRPKGDRKLKMGEVENECYVMKCRDEKRATISTQSFPVERAGAIAQTNVGLCRCPGIFLNVSFFSQ
jgi:hypothetical protein